MPDSLEIAVNGEPRDVELGSTVADLLRELGQDPRAVAVERNGRILPRRDFASTELGAGDRLEVVRFVQGGNLAPRGGRWVYSASGGR